MSSSSSSSLRARVAALLPSLSNSRHKGQAGRVAVVGGSLEYTGAPFFAASAALRAGADLAHVFCQSSAGTSIKALSPDLIVHPVLEPGDDWRVGAERAAKWLPAIDVLVVGPGLGREEGMLRAARMLTRAADEAGKIVVIDGDGLWALRDDDALLSSLSARVILTPNKAEWARLEPQIAGRKLSALVVRKGTKDVAGSLECATRGSPRRCGGQGDVLAGTLAAMAFFGEKELELMAWAACDLVREASGVAFGKRHRGMVASDVLAEMADTMQRIYPVKIEEEEEEGKEEKKKEEKKPKE